MKKVCQMLSVMLMIGIVLMLTACGGVKVTFDIGDAALVSGETVQTYKDGAPVSAPVLTKEGYEFSGWDRDFSAPTEDMTVRPLWKKIHTVTFEAEGAAAKDASLLTQKIVDGSAAKAPEVTRDGYEFDGWDKDFSAVTADMTIRAKWKKVHKVVFDLDGGDAADAALLEQKVTDGNAATAPVPTKDKFVFVKWDKDFSAVTGDMTVKAVWERKIFSATEIHDLVNPATVEIKSYRLNHVYYSMGSGFFISEDGLLLTNYHVIEEAREFQLTTSDGAKYPVKTVVAYDIDKDIAILQADLGGKKVEYLEIAPALPKSGAAVYAIGSSLGLTGTFSSGIVSYVNREIDGVKFIQTTTPISAGNSGGPLVDEHGYVIGINSASYTAGQNLNLAVEISQYATLKTVNLTPEQLFQKEATLKYFIGEYIVAENKKSSTTGQSLADGHTVRGKIEVAEEIDYYLTTTPKEDVVLLAMIKSTGEEPLEDIAHYATPFAAKTADVNAPGAGWLNKYYLPLGIVEDGNGDYYYIGMVVLPEEITKEYSFVGFALSADSPAQYDLFLYYINEEIANAFS